MQSREGVEIFLRILALKIGQFDFSIAFGRLECDSQIPLKLSSPGLSRCLLLLTACFLTGRYVK